MGNACSGTFSIENKLNDDLTRNDYSLSDGKWSKAPMATLAKAQSASNFAKAISKDCEMIGPGGTMKYGLPDGTVFNMNFSVPYGSSSPFFNCSAEGPRAHLYECTHTNFTSGYNPSTTITIKDKDSQTRVKAVASEDKPKKSAKLSTSGPTVAHHDVSPKMLSSLLEHLEKVGGWTINTENNITTLTAENTLIHLKYDTDTQLLECRYEQVPVGLETYFWGHSHQRLHLFLDK